MPKKVYISSTYKDLIAYRDAIREMFQFKGLQNEYMLVSMEGYVSESGKRAIEVCLDDVRQADVYILILAKRYGSIVDGTDISYTEMEYNEAVEVSGSNPFYKIFVFWSREESEKDDFATIQGLENPNLEKFYRSALKGNASFIHPFSTPDNLCKQILLTLNYNFKKPSNVNDYQDALIFIDRTEQSYSFSKLIKENANSYYFTSLYENNPNDFIERLYELEMGGKYKKCNIELGQFYTVDKGKFRETFIAELSSQWRKDVSNYHFQKIDKLFLSLEINSIEINSEIKLENLRNVLLEFLPTFLIEDEGNYINRVFFIFYTCLENENPTNKKFDDFIRSLINSLRLKRCLTSISQLNDITKTDIRNWLSNFVKSRKFDQDEVDEILQVNDDHLKTTFKMKEAKKLIKGWIKKNLATN